VETLRAGTALARGDAALAQFFLVARLRNRNDERRPQRRNSPFPGERLARAGLTGARVEARFSWTTLGRNHAVRSRARRRSRRGAQAGGE
jgi:hypothetical protein